jgi:hypothetical protein
MALFLSACGSSGDPGFTNWEIPIPVDSLAGDNGEIDDPGLIDDRDALVPDGEDEWSWDVPLPDHGPGIDVVDRDSGDQDLADTTDDGVPAECPHPEDFDYSCTTSDPSTCPGGLCVLGQCIAPTLDPRRWDDCGNDFCDPCETAASCPADCGDVPVIPAKEYVNDTTLTIWVHGFSNKSQEKMEDMVYGQEKGCSGLLGEMRNYGVDIPCGDKPDTSSAPNQMIKLQYYGGKPAPWMTPGDIEEIEQYPYTGNTALTRYALIVGKFIRHKLRTTGATHVNLACHSMGCYVLRTVIERNIEGLAGEGRFVRWFTSAGVIAGARLARLYDNPTVRDASGLIGLELSDFIIMHPDFVQDNACVWDHRLQEGNSPYLKGTLIHHLCGTDPQIREALNIALLDLNNPGDEPNDGIMYTEDQYFHSQKDTGSHRTPSRKVVSATHSYVREYHMEVPNSPPASVLAAAALFHGRKVWIRLKTLELLKDRESRSPFDGENGAPPAEISLSVQVRYNPYVQQSFGHNILINEEKVEHRTPVMVSMKQGDKNVLNLPVFEGPVFDDMTSLRLDLTVLEVDWYPRYEVREWAFDIHQALVSFNGQVPLENKDIPFSSQYAKGVLEVRVVQLY